MELSDIRTEVRQRLGLSSSDSRVDNTLLTALINAALRQAQTEMDWPWYSATESLSLVDGTQSYTPNAVWRKTYDLSIQGNQLQYVQPQDIIRYSTEEGYPRVFSIIEGDIYVAPTPDTSYTATHHYMRTELTLSGDTDEPLWPDWAIDYIISKVAQLVAVSLRDADMQRLLAKENSEARQAIMDELRQAGGTTRPRHRRDWDWMI